MTIQLPSDLEIPIQAAVQRGRFASLDDAMAQAARLLLDQIGQARIESTTKFAETPDPLLGSMRDHADEMDAIVEEAMQHRERMNQLSSQPNNTASKSSLGFIGALHEDAELLDKAVEYAMKVREERPWRLSSDE